MTQKIIPFAIIIGALLVFAIFFQARGDAFSVHKPFYIYLGICAVCIFLFGALLHMLMNRIVIASFLCIILLGIGVSLWTFSMVSKEKLFHDAARYNHLFALKMLLFKEGMNKSRIDDALIDSCIVGNSDIARYLLEKGANPNKRLFDNEPVLLIASGSGSSETVKMLIEHGADINASDNENTTPLIRAAFTNSPEIVRLLLNKNANPCIKNTRGQTALDIAETYHFDEVRQLLEPKTQICNQ